MSTIVEVCDVDVERDGRRVLSGVDFRLESGELVGLIGSNGAGKTTLWQVLLGLLPATRGEVLWNDDALARRRVGYVPQRIVLDADVPLRVRDFVALGVDGHRFGLRRRARDTWQRVDEVLASVEASALSDRRMGELSGGELQRVLLAHALVSDPELLLLDEPLANLDPGATQDIVELLVRVRDREGVSVVLSAHDINSLVGAMDRVVYVANSRVASGPTEEVVTPEVLSALYGHHVDVVRVHGRVLVVTGEFEDRSVLQHPPLVVE